MARTEVFTDDIDGSEGAQPFYFTIDGTSYVIDLAEGNVDKFNRAIARFVDKARDITKRPTGTNGEAALMRSWALSNGFPDLPARGRIPQDVQDSYHAAHPS